MGVCVFVCARVEHLKFDLCELGCEPKRMVMAI